MGSKRDASPGPVNDPLSPYTSRGVNVSWTQPTKASNDSEGRPRARRSTELLPIVVFILLLQRRHDVRIRQRRRIAERSAFRDVTQQPPHDLA